MTAPIRIGWRHDDGPEVMLAREWLVTNGLGGYASGTLAGAPTRRTHSLLVAALPAPLGRTLVLNHLSESVRSADGTSLRLTGLEPEAGAVELPGALAEFSLHGGRPVWRYEHEELVLEKTVVLPHRQNTAHVIYRLLSARAPLTLILEPAFDVRPHDASVGGAGLVYRVEHEGSGIAIVTSDPRYPAVRLAPSTGGAQSFVARPRAFDLVYRIERARGYDWQGRLSAPGAFEIALPPGAQVALTVSTEAPNAIGALSAAEALALDDERRARLVARAAPALQDGHGAELVLAADQFIITPHTRPRDETRSRAEGDDARTIIAGYPWFTDWGRDTMISLEGLTLATGEHEAAREIIHTFARHVRDGLIPNFFPEGEQEGVYHTADATLWFFHALDRYERLTGDGETRRLLLPTLVEIVEAHVRGTRFGIGVDPADGLLRQGAPGYQLTWMDAKVGDWVVTPRRGKAVEINALFYEALRLLESWLRDAEGEGAAGQQGIRLRADDVAARAEQLRINFNRRFWSSALGHLYDVVDAEDGGDDATLRPNQVLSISLPHPVLDRERWEPVLTIVRGRLLTPFGLRSLAPGHPDYKPRYDGDLRARDAAYHQGTVWAWLMGPFVDAWLKAFPDDRAGAAAVVAGLDDQLRGACVGTISEIYDAEPPFSPRGCVAQAWSVAEALRVLLAVAPPVRP